MLRCPNCGDECTHHEEVAVYSREEDAGWTRTEIAARTGACTQDASDEDDGRGNPSPRREAVRIALWCETCNGRFSLEVLQHKGRTYVQLVTEMGRSPMETPDEDAYEEAEQTVRAMDPEALASEIERQITRRGAKELEENRDAGLKRGTRKQRQAIASMARMDDHALIALAIRLGRLHPSRAELEDRATPIAWLSRPETGALYEVARAVAQARRRKAVGGGGAGAAQRGGEAGRARV